MYTVQIKDTKRNFSRAKDAINYFKESSGLKSKITWQMVKSLDFIQVGDFKLFYDRRN